MKHVVGRDLCWTDASTPGTRRAEIVRDAAGGGMALWNVPAGRGFPRHAHKGFEYIYVLSGVVDFSGHILEKGDVLLTARDEVHEAKALKDAVILVVNERANA